MNRRDQARAGGDARPAVSQLERLGVYVAQADGSHLRDAPLDRFVGLRRSGNTAADVVAEVFEIIERVVIDGGLARDGSERGQCAVLRGSGSWRWNSISGEGESSKKADNGASECGFHGRSGKRCF